MMVPASVLMTYAGAAAGCAALGRRDRALARSALGVAAIAAAFVLWPADDGAALAGLCVVLSLSAMATVFALLEPVVPRVAWWAAAWAPVAAAVLALV
jgi:hypothetical protein